MKTDEECEIILPMPWGPIAGKTFGKENATPVLCVHGRSDNLETFCHLIPLLAKNYYYVCIDLPGHGKSAHAEKGYIIDLLWYTMCVKRVIDYFKWSRFCFLGHSLGGQIGFLTSAIYPELVIKLIIIDTLLFFHIPPPKTAQGLRDFLFDPILKLEKRSSLNEAPTYSFLDFVKKMKETRMTEVTEEQIKHMAERNLIKVDRDKYKYGNDQRVKMLGSIHFTYDQLESMGSDICCPTLLIFGKNSLTTRPEKSLSRSPLQKNVNAKFNIIEGDHDVHIAHPQEVAHLINSFLSSETISKL